ncbi:NADPH-dependent FMN reductase [Candidatus Magnetomorum sp. HK-1]|nr:NADPH-dependent FMN reductase [Candidatus Magnetomorum sp. HK-1]
MKLVSILGSPRKNGNSAILTQDVIDIAEQSNASIQSFHLNQLNYKGCQACMACKTKTDHCVIKDDLQDVLTAIRDCDILVLASPVYFADVTSQMKGLIDRTYSFLVPDFLSKPQPSRLQSGKTLIFILPQAQPDEKMFADLYPKYEFFLKIMGFTNAYPVRACGVLEAGSVKERSDIRDKVREIAQNIFGA